MKARRQLGSRAARIIVYTVGLSGLFVLVQVILGIAAVVAVKLGAPEEVFTRPAAVLLYSSIVYAVVFAIAIGFQQRWLKQKTSRDELALARLMEWKDIGLGAVAFIPYAILSQLVLSLCAAVMPWVDVAQKQELGFGTHLYGFELGVAFVALVVVAPFAEELLFRGYLYGKLRRYSNMIVASLVVSVCFGVLHGAWNVGIDVFVLSMVACLLREVTGSIWAGVLLHAVKNGLAFYILFINPSLLSTIGG